MDHIKIPIICVEAIMALTVPERGRLLGSLLRYSQGSEEGAEEPRGNEYSLYLVIKAQMDRDLEVSKKRAEAGREGGKAKASKASKCKQSVANDSTPPSLLPSPPTPPVSIFPPPKEKPPKGGKEKGPMRRPTVEEVRAYCAERGNSVDPQAFVDFYESKGWLVGKSPMKDWKAAVRTWEHSRRQEGGPSVGTERLVTLADIQRR